MRTPSRVAGGLGDSEARQFLQPISITISSKSCTRIPTQSSSSQYCTVTARLWLYYDFRRSATRNWVAASEFLPAGGSGCSALAEYAGLTAARVVTVGVERSQAQARITQALLMEEPANQYNAYQETGAGPGSKVKKQIIDLPVLPPRPFPFMMRWKAAAPENPSLTAWAHSRRAGVGSRSRWG
eukprot:37580-Rhodomonas_salina.2